MPGSRDIDGQNPRGQRVSYWESSEPDCLLARTACRWKDCPEGISFQLFGKNGATSNMAG